MAANLERVHPNVAKHFQGYPLERLWYLLFDYNRRDLGPAGFDRPPQSQLEEENAGLMILVPQVEDRLGTSDSPLGSLLEEEKEEDKQETHYLRGMFAGLNYLLETIDTPLSTEYLLALHNQAISATLKNRPCGKEYRDGQRVSSGLTVKGLRRNVTLDGLRELREKINSGDNYFRILFMREYDNYFAALGFSYLTETDKKKCSDSELHESEHRFEQTLEKLKRNNVSDEEFYQQIESLNDAVVMRVVCYREEILKRLNDIIGEFNARMKNPEASEIEKISVIAWCVREILLAHPFHDGNGRTTSLLLNKLLLQYDLSPTILDNPTLIDAFSIDEICEEIKKGQAVFRAQKDIPLPKDPMITTNEIVLYLEGNPNVAALLVHAAVAGVSNWGLINIGDRNLARDRLVEELCKNSGKLNAAQIHRISEEILDKIFNATYKRGPFQFFSSGNMVSEVAQSICEGRFEEAAHKVFSGNQYGIDSTQLNSGNDNPTRSRSFTR